MTTPDSPQQDGASSGTPSDNATATESPAAERLKAIAQCDRTREEYATFRPAGFYPVRHVLVQNPEDPRPGTLGRMVSGRKHRALLLYLLLLWSWRWLKDSREPLASDVWLRALTAEDVTGSLTWSQSALSRAWRDLEHFGLIEDRVRDGRLLKVVPRREDSLAAYRAPAGERDRHNKYFTLPNTFWIDKYFAKLKLPGLAMLLIIAKETSGGPERPIPFNRVAEWYGISSRTAQNGVAELEALGLVHKRYEVKDAPLSKTGSTTWIHYSLTGPFSYEARMLAQQAAQIARTKNSNPVPNPPPASSANTPAVDAKPAVAG